MEEGVTTKVRNLLDKATTSTAAEVDPRLLKGIKSVVRSSDVELRTASHYLMDLMKRDHSQVRYLSLLIIDELFMRSKLFRTIIVGNFDLLLSLSVGFRKNMLLPPPSSVASTLRSKAIEFLEKWNISFGIHYPQIRLGYDYLKNTLRLHFPDIRVIQTRLEQERREKEMRSAEITKNKFNILKEKFPSIKQEIQSTIDEVEECLTIAHSKVEDSANVPLDEEDCEEFRSLELKQIRLTSLRQSDVVHEDNENKPIFDTIRELYKLLVTKHLVCIQEWITVVLKVESVQINLRDSMLKDLIDLRNNIQSAKQRCGESISCVAQSKKENIEEEGFWEEGEGSELNKASTSNRVVEKPVVDKSDSSRTETGKKKGRRNELDSVKSKLLSEAPVIQWGSYLDHWGSKEDLLLNRRGLDLENHWGRVDYDAAIPAEKVTELNMRATLYHEDKKVIPPCCAPLKNGGFCQRRDLKVCPIHGPSKRESFTQVDEDLATQLAKKAVKNLREQNVDVLSQKRAKRVKIREHNEGVLRDAAMASTSSAYLTENVVNDSQTATLASMLRKKVSAKDRIGNRLLNSRTNHATTRQLSSGEDANYREAFPNQW